MATPFRILAWEIPWTEEPGGLQSMGSQKESDTTQQPNNHNNNQKLTAKMFRYPLNVIFRAINMILLK